MTKIIVSTLFFSLALAAPLKAQTADPAIGHRLAREVCSACHQVDPETPAKNKRAGAPSFADVAQMPSTNERAISVFLRSSHTHMPNIILSPEEIDSVASFIVGLKRK